MYFVENELTFLDAEFHSDIKTKIETYRLLEKNHGAFFTVANTLKKELMALSFKDKSLENHLRKLLVTDIDRRIQSVVSDPSKENRDGDTKTLPEPDSIKTKIKITCREVKADVKKYCKNNEDAKNQLLTAK